MDFNVRRVDGGTVIDTLVPGNALSSTRAELVGVILAAALPCAVEVATDSMAVVSRYARLVAARWRTSLINRPNGDLWGVLAQQCRARRWPLRLRWVKGHKEQGDCASESERADSRGNAKADFYAGVARREGFGSLARIADYAFVRGKAYAGLMVDLHKCMVAVLRANPRGQEARKASLARARRTYQLPGYAGQGARGLTLMLLSASGLSLLRAVLPITF